MRRKGHEHMIAIIDYDAGNIKSVEKAMHLLGQEVVVTRDRESILKADLYGTAVLLEEVGKVIAPGGVGVTISSQSGHRMPALTPNQYP